MVYYACTTYNNSVMICVLICLCLCCGRLPAVISYAYDDRPRLYPILLFSLSLLIVLCCFSTQRLPVSLKTLLHPRSYDVVGVFVEQGS